MRIGIDLIKGMANVALTLAFFYGCGWWLFVGWPEQTRRVEDPIFATHFFEGLLPVAEVLQSRRYNPRGETWGCTYAIVRIGDPMPLHPPSRDLRERPVDPKDLIPWDFHFGGDWRETPAAALGPNIKDSIGFCQIDWPETLVQEMRDALATPGGWYVRDVLSETVYLYAPKQRLAARVRFGD